MRIMCGSVCIDCVNSWMPGRLELRQPVFHVIIFRLVVRWVCVCMVTGGIGFVFTVFVVGW